MRFSLFPSYQIGESIIPSNSTIESFDCVAQRELQKFWVDLVVVYASGGTDQRMAINQINIPAPAATAAYEEIKRLIDVMGELFEKAHELKIDSPALRFMKYLHRCIPDNYRQ